MTEQQYHQKLPHRQRYSQQATRRKFFESLHIEEEQSVAATMAEMLPCSPVTRSNMSRRQPFDGSHSDSTTTGNNRDDHNDDNHTRPNNRDNYAQAIGGRRDDDDGGGRMYHEEEEGGGDIVSVKMGTIYATSGTASTAFASYNNNITNNYSKPGHYDNGRRVYEDSGEEEPESSLTADIEHILLLANRQKPRAATDAMTRMEQQEDDEDEKHETRTATSIALFSTQRDSRRTTHRSSSSTTTEEKKKKRKGNHHDDNKSKAGDNKDSEVDKEDNEGDNVRCSENTNSSGKGKNTGGNDNKTTTTTTTISRPLATKDSKNDTDGTNTITTAGDSGSGSTKNTEVRVRVIPSIVHRTKMGGKELAAILLPQKRQKRNRHNKNQKGENGMCHEKDDYEGEDEDDDDDDDDHCSHDLNDEDRDDDDDVVSEHEDSEEEEHEEHRRTGHDDDDDKEEEEEEDYFDNGEEETESEEDDDDNDDDDDDSEEETDEEEKQRVSKGTKQEYSSSSSQHSFSSSSSSSSLSSSPPSPFSSCTSSPSKRTKKIAIAPHSGGKKKKKCFSTSAAVTKMKKDVEKKSTKKSAEGKATVAAAHTASIPGRRGKESKDDTNRRSSKRERRPTQRLMDYMAFEEFEQEQKKRQKNKTAVQRQRNDGHNAAVDVDEKEEKKKKNKGGSLDMITTKKKKTKEDSLLSSSASKKKKLTKTTMKNQARGRKGGVVSPTPEAEALVVTEEDINVGKKDEETRRVSSASGKGSNQNKEPVVVGNGDYHQIDEIACCLCGCSVDYTDRSLFLPKSTITEENTSVTDREVFCNNSSEKHEKEEKAKDVSRTTGTDEGEGGAASWTEGDKNVKKKNDDEKTPVDGRDPGLEELAELAACATPLDYEMMSKISEENEPDDGSAAARGTAIKGGEKELSGSIADVNKTAFEAPTRNGLPLLPSCLHDSHNAILLCDGPGCNRAYHQRCHFVPVFSIPRGEWYCLICQYKQLLKTIRGNERQRTSQKSRKKRSKIQKEKSSLDMVLDPKLVFADHQDLLRQLEEALRGDEDAASNVTSNAQLDELFRLLHSASVAPVGKDEVAGPILPAPSRQIQELTAEHRRELEEKFERDSAVLKSYLLYKELKIRMKSTMKKCLERIRNSRNSIRVYTETDRARKGVVQRYEMTGRLPREVVESLCHLAESKLKIRGVLVSLNKVISGYYERKVLLKWLQEKHGKGVNGLKPSPEVVSVFFPQKSRCWRVEARWNRDAEEEEMVPSTLPKRTEEISSNDDVARIMDPGGHETIVSSEESEKGGKGTTKSMPSMLGSADGKIPGRNNKKICTVCLDRNATSGNNLLSCDHCSRSFHVKCVTHSITQEKMVDMKGSWSCPLCSTLVGMLKYIQKDYASGEWEQKSKRKEDGKADSRLQEPSEKSRSESSQSIEKDDPLVSKWEEAEDLFLGVERENEVIMKLKGGFRDESTDKLIYSLFGVLPNKRYHHRGVSVNSKANTNSDEKHDHDFDLEGSAERKGDLSGQDGHDVQVSVADIGLIDEANILPGKRKRKRIDYKRLSGVLFGSSSASDTKNALDEDDSSVSRTSKKHLVARDGTQKEASREFETSSAMRQTGIKSGRHKDAPGGPRYDPFPHKKLTRPPESGSESDSDDLDTEPDSTADEEAATYTDNWEMNFTKLVAYKKLHGHCLVPKVYPDDQSLSRWVFRQRQQFKLRQERKQSNLTQEKIKRLKHIGFVFHARFSEAQREFEFSRREPRLDAIWQNRFEQLKAYKKAHGHCLVPKSYPENQNLSRWVYRQRQLYRHIQQGKPSRLDREKLRKLERIGFAFHARKSETQRKIDLLRKQPQLDALWEKCLARMKAYKKAKGHCLVPKIYPEDQALSRWVFRQRQQYRLLQQRKPSKLTDERLRKLEQIGFIFYARDTNEQRELDNLRKKPQLDAVWEKYFSELLEFKKKRGHCLVPKEYRTNQPLSRWVFRQRHQYRELQEGKPSTLTEERLKKLEQVGFVFNVRKI